MSPCPEPCHFPGDEPAVWPYAAVPAGAVLVAGYRCPSGFSWSLRFTPDSPWPLESTELHLNPENRPSY